MTKGQEFPHAQLDRVHELVNLAKEQFEDGPRNNEWQLDFNLPELHVAIVGLYAALGETDRLERAQAQAAAAQQ